MGAAVAASADDAAVRLGRAIDARRADIEARWLDRVQRDVVQKAGIELTQLRDGIPDYLEGIAKMLVESAGALDERATGLWERTARDHGVTRVRVGFDVTQLVHEFVVLRHVIREVVAEEGLLGSEHEALLSDIIGAAIAASVDAYVKARDYESRRAQAEHIGFLIHELRNPLSTAMVAAGRLRRAVGADHSKLLDALDRGHERLSDLIDDVLLTSTIEAGTLQSSPADIELGHLLDPALEAARRLAEQKGLSLRLRYDPRAIVRVDVELTRSAVQNLADNAAKYTDSGSIEIGARGGGDEDLEIHVSDTCDGLSPEELGTIFEPFRRGRTRKAGTGLGLAIARRAVEAQGGSIHAESPGASGCHFWIRLPNRATQAQPTRFLR